MTTQEAITQVSALMIQLIERIKDSKTAALVQKIQSLNQAIQAAYFAAEQKALNGQNELLDSNRKIFQMEQDHAKAIESIRAEHTKAIDEKNRAIANLNAKIARMEVEPPSPPKVQVQFPGGDIQSPI